MTWRSSIVVEWKCDGCGVEVTAADELEPEGWVHSEGGRDLCAECQA